VAGGGDLVVADGVFRRNMAADGSALSSISPRSLKISNTTFDDPLSAFAGEAAEVQVRLYSALALQLAIHQSRLTMIVQCTAGLRSQPLRSWRILRIPHALYILRPLRQQRDRPRRRRLHRLPWRHRAQRSPDRVRALPIRQGVEDRAVHDLPGRQDRCWRHVQ
jgi:hypothetical protein